ncbi:MAG: hypothetical protein HYZ72_12855 [Deltaproteobacteria bacterium]|nr:hypothetical protein [Deltaproteobacteria bacterium]
MVLPDKLFHSHGEELAAWDVHLLGELLDLLVEGLVKGDSGFYMCHSELSFSTESITLWRQASNTKCATTPRDHRLLADWQQKQIPAKEIQPPLWRRPALVLLALFYGF